MKQNDQNNFCPAKKTSIGGQALMEGIMMRGPQRSAMAVRNPQGEIVIEEWDTEVKKRPKITKLPVIRGIFGFIDSMSSGYRCLMRSAEISGLEEAEAEYEREKQQKKAEKQRKKSGALSGEDSGENAVLPEEMPAESQREPGAEKDTPASALPKAKEEKKTSPLMVVFMVITVIFSFALALGLFILIPSYSYRGLCYLFPALAAEGHPALASFYKSAIEMVFKIVMMTLYMFCMRFMKDIRRTFSYHGAEHKTIFCYEHGKELTVENVRSERRFHPRCGTSFLVLMALVGFFIGFLIDPVAILITGHAIEATWLRVLIRIALIPLIMGIGYEVLKFAGRHENLFTKIISAPGIWFQHLTVLEPDDSMIECAIAAFVRVIPKDESDNW